MYPRSFLCEKAIIKIRVLPQKKNFVKSVRKQYGILIHILFLSHIDFSFQNFFLMNVHEV